MLKHQGTVTLKTERLVLREYRKGEEQIMFDNWTCDERVAKYTKWFVHQDVSETKLFLDYILSKNSLSDYNWIIELDGIPIGSINVVESDDEAELCGLGYNIGYDFWNKGYMTEAAKAVVGYLFYEIGYRKIVAACDSQNPGSENVMKHLGMKKEGIRRQHIKRKDGSFGDVFEYGLLKNEYKE